MSRLAKLPLGLAWVLLTGSGPAQAAALAVQNRVALVIGNDTYQHVEPLRNARADARAIAKEFERVGFKVLLRLDQNEKAMKDDIRTFKGMVAGGDVAVFYFSGHGVQLGGANYILPVDIRGDSEDQVRDEALPLQRVLDDLQDQKAKFSLAIIDACRNNPFKGAGRSLGGRGLAVTAAATGQMVLFSAGAGQQALDSLGPGDHNPNGLFTRVLLKEMDKPGVPVDKVLRNTRDEVVRLSHSAGQEQVPALYDQALGEFYFLPPKAQPSPAPEPSAGAQGGTTVSGLGAPPVASALLGGLQVSVNVPGTQVYLEGELKGKATPTQALNLRDLPVGHFTLKAEAPGYPAKIQPVEIQEAQWTQVKLIFSKHDPAPAPLPAAKLAAPPPAAAVAETPAPAPAVEKPSFWASLVGAKPAVPGYAAGPDGTPLSKATINADEKKMKELILNSADVNAFDKWGWTPLHWACYYGKIEVVTFLLEQGANPNAKGVKSYSRFKVGATPLIVAAYFGFDEPLGALMKHHADPKLTDADSKSALDYATAFNFDTCVELLKSN